MSRASVKDLHLRSIKSFVVRGGRLTLSQQLAMESCWPKYGLEQAQGIVDKEVLFGRNNELVLEIGFGMGDSLIVMAQQNPLQDFIGIDVHPPGIGALLRDLQEHDLKNVRVYQGDATLILQECFKDNYLDKIQIFFPDPWHKKRHHKRRLIQLAFVEQIRQKLKPAGILHLATDWQDYAEQMMSVMTASKGFHNNYGQAEFAIDHQRPSTKFQRRGERLGHGVWDLIFNKV